MNDNGACRVPQHPPDALLLRRSEPESRAVLEDWYESQGARLTVWWLPEDYDDDGYGDGGDGGGGGDDGYGYGCGDGGYGDGGYGYDDGYGDGGDGYKQKENDMKDGLKLIVIGGASYNFVLIGWLRRRVGDEYELHGARVVRRFGRNAALAGLAAKGPKAGETPAELLEASVEPEEIHRLLVRRAIPANPKAWADECPCPASWKDLTSVG